MSIETIKIAGSDSGRVPPIDAKMAQYAINAKQQFCVVSVDFGQYPIDFEDVPGIQYLKIGKLEEQPEVFKAQVCNSLNNDGWDFEAYPNPEVIMINNINYESQHYNKARS